MKENLSWCVGSVLVGLWGEVAHVEFIFEYFARSWSVLPFDRGRTNPKDEKK